MQLNLTQFQLIFGLDIPDSIYPVHTEIQPFSRHLPLNELSVTVLAIAWGAECSHHRPAPDHWTYARTSNIVICSYYKHTQTQKAHMQRLTHTHTHVRDNTLM